MKDLTRRDFLKTAAAGAAGLVGATLLPDYLFAEDKLEAPPNYSALIEEIKTKGNPIPFILVPQIE